MDLIDRKAVMSTLGDLDLPDVHAALPVSLMLAVVKKALEPIPSVDAVPVKHGRWEGDETCNAYDIAGVKTWAVKRKCSECRFTHNFIEAHMCYVFCPNCGAKMDGGDADDHG